MMSNLQYRNPITPFITLNPVSVSRNEVFGTNFSVLGVGGYMEVYNLSDLNYTIPAGQTGTIEFTGNTIPIEFKKGTGSAFSTDVLVLNSDNISSGRRRLGMLVYVYETDRIYQYTIRNYDSLWSAATASTGPGGRTVVISSFGTTVKANSVAGQNFINAWTASTIEGVGGFNNSNATWRVLSTGGGTVSGDYLPLSGGTVTGPTRFTSGLSANTISATTYSNYPGSSASNCITTLFTSNISGCSPVTILTPLSVTEGANFTGTTRFYDDVSFSSGFTINSLTNSNILVLSGNNIGIGTSNPKTLLQVGDGGGAMSYPYEQLVVEKNGDTKLSIYTSVSSPSSAGASLSLGYSNFLTDSNLYPGFEFQHIGSVFSTGNYIRYNFIQRDASGDVSVPNSKKDLFNIYSDGSVIINSHDVISKLGVGVLESHISNTLHVSANTNPVRIEGLSSSTTDSKIITLDNDGVLHTYPLSSLTGGTSASGDYLPLSGGTVTGRVIFQSGLTANTISATTYQNLPVTADTFVTGFTFNVSNYNLTINQNNGQSPLTQSLSILASDLYVTGGTYNSNTGVATFTNNTGGTFQVTGFLTGFTDTLVTAFTYSNNTFTITDSRGSGFTATINTMTGLTATTISATTYLNLPSATFTGGTVSGPTNFLSGLTANTISATTYQNLPVTADTFTTAATFSVSTGIITFNRNNNTPNYTVTGLTGFTSAFTYSNNVFTISRSGTSNLTALINTVTGFTINGNLTVTGTSTVNNLTITGTTALNGPINSGTLSGTTTRMLEVSSGGSVTATKEIITAYITSGGTAANLLENTSNWSINGVYTGTTITGTFQGQKHYNNNYFFEAVADNIFIRLIRG